MKQGSKTKCYEYKTMRKEGRRVITIQAMTSYHTELKPLVHTRSHPRNPALYLFPPQLSSFPKSPQWNGKPFINSNLSSNYTVRQRLNAQSLLHKVVCWQLCILKASRTARARKILSFHKHFPCYNWDKMPVGSNLAPAQISWEKSWQCPARW